MRVLVVEPGKQPEEREIDGSLESMQQIVGGLIQAIYPFDDTVALICNDEGKLLGLPWNRVVGYDIIAGTFFLCDAPPDSENFKSLTEEQLRLYSQLLKMSGNIK